MNTNEYLERLIPQYAAYFNVERPVELFGTRFEAHCAFSSRSEKYVLVKKAQLWAAENYEHVFFLRVETLAREVLEQAVSFLKERLEPEFVKPHKEHMYTYLTLIILCTGTEPDAEKALKRFRYERNYRFSLYGWCTARVLAVDLEAKRVISNPQGKEVKKLLGAALHESSAN